MNPESNIPKNQGFKIPKDYFENFKEQLDARLTLEQAIAQKKNPGFEVPPFYFENKKWSFAQEALLHPGYNQTTIKRLPVIRYVTLAIAAAVLFLLVLKPFGQSGIDFTKIDAMTAEAYLEKNNLENIEYDLEWIAANDDTDVLLDGLTASDESIFQYLQQETDLMDLNLD